MLFEFFDLKNDVLERNGLSVDELPEEVHKIKKQMEKELSRHPQFK